MLGHTLRMKRTTLVLDRPLLDEVTHVLGAESYSAAVNRAMEEFLRMRKIRDLSRFFGKGLWKGGLGEMPVEGETGFRAIGRRPRSRSRRGR